MKDAPYALHAPSRASASNCLGERKEFGIWCGTSERQRRALKAGGAAPWRKPVSVPTAKNAPVA